MHRIICIRLKRCLKPARMNICCYSGLTGSPYQPELVGPEYIGKTEKYGEADFKNNLI